MIKEFFLWLVAVVSFLTALTIAGFTAGIIYGLLSTAFEIGKLLWG